MDADETGIPEEPSKTPPQPVVEDEPTVPRHSKRRHVFGGLP